MAHAPGGAALRCADQQVEVVGRQAMGRLAPKHLRGALEQANECLKVIGNLKPPLPPAAAFMT